MKQGLLSDTSEGQEGEFLPLHKLPKTQSIFGVNGIEVVLA